MTPYYADETVTIYHGEALNILSEMDRDDIATIASLRQEVARIRAVLVLEGSRA